MSQTDVDLSRLSLRDALDLAILVEEEARDRYLELGEQLEMHRTPAAAAFFRRMSRIEERHRVQLSDRRQRQFGHEPSVVDRGMLFDVEAPSYDAARAFMPVRAALEAALAAEVKAHAFFEGALAAIGDPEVRALFEELRDEEVTHQALVRDELARLPPASAIEGIDTGDEPVAS